MVAAECPIFKQQKPIFRDSIIVPLSGVISQLFSGSLITQTIYIMVRAAFVLTGIDTSKKMRKKWAHTHGIHWSCYVPESLIATSFTEPSNGLLKTQLQCWLGSNTL